MSANVKTEDVMQSAKNSSIQSLVTNSSLVPGENKAKGILMPTPGDVLGPFFVLGSPFRAVLTPPGFKLDAPGVERIVITGTLYNANSGEPLSFTVIDMWQAQPDATYDFQQDEEFKGKPYHPSQDPYIIAGETGVHSEDYAFRTRLLTDHKGRYHVETIVPPPYFDPDDVCECNTECLCAWRCPHIHAFVQPTSDKGCSPLITQLYFEGRKYNDTDKHFNKETLIAIEQKDNYLSGTFDLVLSSTKNE